MIRLALSSGTLPLLLAALFTYLLHSTLFVAVVWAVTRLSLRWQAGAANKLWRLALVAPLLTTALALALPGQAHLHEVRLDPGALLAEAAAPGAPIAAVPEAASPALPPAPAEAAAPPPSARIVLVGLALLGLIGLGRLALLGGRLLIFRRGLRDRQPLQGGRALERLHAVLARAGHAAGRPTIRLSMSQRVLVPMAIGSGEICLPRQALEELADPELDAVLAHELGHLERGDNRWLTLAAALEAVLFFQPLTALVRRRLQDSAELACDERAVELTGSARALARSLAEVAAWNLGGEPAVPVAAIAHRSGLLLRRVQTLLSDPAPARKRLGAGGVRLLLGGVCAVGLLLPAVGSCRHGGDRARTGGLQAAAAAPAAGQPSAALPAASATGEGVQAPESPEPPAPSMPPFPMPPLPPPSMMEPVGALVSGVMSGIVPQAVGGAGKLVPLATREATLEMQLERLEARQADRRLTEEEARRLPELRRELAAARHQLREAERKLEREMEAVEREFERTHGKELERQMERWGEEYGRSMEKWGERFGKDMEKWAQTFGRQMEQWGAAFERGVERGAPPAPPAPVPAPTRD
jgi:beta-lactamase regulating signal transducer with metallopeptidase domain